MKTSQNVPDTCSDPLELPDTVSDTQAGHRGGGEIYKNKVVGSVWPGPLRGTKRLHNDPNILTMVPIIITKIITSRIKTVPSYTDR